MRLRLIDTILIVAGILIGLSPVVLNALSIGDSSIAGPLEIGAISFGVGLIVVGLLLMAGVISLERVLEFSLHPPTIIARHLPPLILIVAGFLLFSSTGRDDPYLSYWPAFSLSEFGEIVNYNGEPIEQSSSLLLVVLLASIRELTTISPSLAGPLISILMGSLTVYLVGKIAELIEPRSGFIAAILAGTSFYLVYWSFSGMETSLTSLLVLLFVGATGTFLSKETIQRQDYAWTIAVVVLIFAVRPETSLVIIASIVGLFILLALSSIHRIDEWSRGKTRLSILLLISILCFSLLAGFRRLYFGAFFPQPVIAKAGDGIFGGFDEGLAYFARTVLQSPFISILWVLILFAFLYMLWLSFSRGTWNYYRVLTLVIIAAYVSFIIFGGGDWMENGRFFVPIIPLCALMIAAAIIRLSDERTLHAILFSIVLVVQFVSLDLVARDWSAGMPLAVATRISEESVNSQFNWFDHTKRDHLRDIPTIIYLTDLIEELEPTSSDKLVIYSHQMGMIPYHLSVAHFGTLRFVDVKGLSTTDFVDCSISESWDRAMDGLEFPYREFLNDPETFAAQCHLPAPDVIYDVILSDDHLSLIENGGYVITYQQTGRMYIQANRYNGLALPFEQFVAVRHDLFESLGEPERIVLDFAEFRRSHLGW